MALQKEYINIIISKIFEIGFLQSDQIRLAKYLQEKNDPLNTF